MAALSIVSFTTGATSGTVAGAADWRLFGPTDNTKSGGGGTISGLSVFNNGALNRYSGDPYTIPFTGGVSPASGTWTGNVYNDRNDGPPFSQTGDGIEFTLPADTNSRRARVDLSCYEAVLGVSFHLSDNSATDVSDTSTVSATTGNVKTGVVTVDYAAASAGQTLRVRIFVQTATGISANIAVFAAQWVLNAGGGISMTAVGQVRGAEAFGIGAMSLGIAPPGIPSTQALGAPTLGAALAVSGVPGASKVGSGSLSIAVASVGGAPGSEAVGAPVMALGVVTAGIPTGERFGAASIVLGLTPPGILPAEAFGVLALGGDAADLILPSIESAEKFGAPSLVLRIDAAGSPTAERFGVPAPSLGFAVPGVPADEWMGVPSLALELGVLAIPSSARVGTPALGAEHLDPYQLVCIGIPSSLTFGALRLRAYVFERTERTYVVPAERRVLVVDAEDREFGVPPEKRTYEVQKP
jgi:hypothetical protein